MSELEPNRADDFVGLPQMSAPESAGHLLKAAREAQGLHIAALALALKVPVKKLEALESGRLAELPDMVFVRALAASVCRTLKIDPGPVLDCLPSSGVAQPNTKAPALSVPFRAPRNRQGGTLKDQISKPTSFVVLLLLIGGLALIFAPIPEFERWGVAVGPDTTSEPPPEVPRSDTEGPPTRLVETPSLAVGSAASQLSAIPGSNQASGSAVAISKTAIETAPLNLVPVVANDLLVLKARNTSWVEVVDATVSVKLRKVLAAGEVVSVSGAPPLSVVVGRADAVDILVRGKPFDLTPTAKENVARFEVK